MYKIRSVEIHGTKLKGSNQKMIVSLYPFIQQIFLGTKILLAHILLGYAVSK